MEAEAKREGNTLHVKSEMGMWVVGEYLDDTHVLFKKTIVLRATVTGDHAQLSPADPVTAGQLIDRAQLK